MGSFLSKIFGFSKDFVLKIEASLWFAGWMTIFLAVLSSLFYILPIMIEFFQLTFNEINARNISYSILFIILTVLVVLLAWHAYNKCVEWWDKSLFEWYEKEKNQIVMQKTR